MGLHIEHNLSHSSYCESCHFKEGCAACLCAGMEARAKQGLTASRIEQKTFHGTGLFCSTELGKVLEAEQFHAILSAGM